MFSPMDVHTRNLWQKAEKGKFTGSEATTRFPRASCFKKPTCSVPETWGHMCVCVNLASTVSGLCNDGVSTHTPVLQTPLGAAVNKD